MTGQTEAIIVYASLSLILGVYIYNKVRFLLELRSKYQKKKKWKTLISVCRIPRNPSNESLWRVTGEKYVWRGILYYLWVRSPTYNGSTMRVMLQAENRAIEDARDHSTEKMRKMWAYGNPRRMVKHGLRWNC